MPPQPTFWRFLASLHLSVAEQVLRSQHTLRQVWESAHVNLKSITLDTDTIVHTLFGNQMGGRKATTPKTRFIDQRSERAFEKVIVGPSVGP